MNETYDAIRNIKVRYPREIADDEALGYIKDVPLLLKNKYPLVELEITLDTTGYVKLYPKYNSIVRIRRITGYQSKIENFNDAKKDELKARVKHN